MVVLDVTTHDTKVFVLNFKNEIIQEEHFSLKLTEEPSFLEELLAIINETIKK